MSAPHNLSSHRKVTSDVAVTGVEDNANVNFPPPLIHGVGILSALRLNALFPLTFAESTLFWWLGQSLFLFALVVAVPSFRQFAKSGTPVPPNRPIQTLMTSGPFRFSRNPLYLVLASVHGGIALVSGLGWILVTLPVILLIVRFYVIAREEAYLTRRFGEAYLNYKIRVRRWL